MKFYHFNYATYNTNLMNSFINPVPHSKKAFKIPKQKRKPRVENVGEGIQYSKADLLANLEYIW